MHMLHIIHLACVSAFHIKRAVRFAGAPPCSQEMRMNWKLHFLELQILYSFCDCRKHVCYRCFSFLFLLSFCFGIPEAASVLDTTWIQTPCCSGQGWAERWGLQSRCGTGVLVMCLPSLLHVALGQSCPPGGASHVPCSGRRFPVILAGRGCLA